MLCYVVCVRNVEASFPVENQTAISARHVVINMLSLSSILRAVAKSDMQECEYHLYYKTVVMIVCVWSRGFRVY